MSDEPRGASLLLKDQTQYNHVEQKVADLWMDGCQVQRFSKNTFGANKEAHISIYFDQIL